MEPSLMKIENMEKIKEPPGGERGLASRTCAQDMFGIGIFRLSSLIGQIY